MTLEELREELALVLNFNDGQTDQDFTTAQLNAALNSAYKREVREAKLEGNRDFFKSVTSITWAADATTYQLPPRIQRLSGMIDFEDITDADPGVKLSLSDDGRGGAIFWLDYRTLQWGSSGPSEAKTIRITYYSSPEKLVLDSDEPFLIPAEHHELLVWSAAVYLRDLAEDGAPRAWQGRLRTCQFDFIKQVSKGRPASHEPWVGPRTGDTDNESIG